jgi:L-fuculose-phosphate aldolase
MLREICDVLREAYDRGWITSRDGNASFRMPEEDWFYVTPSGVRKQELLPEMCLKLGISDEGWTQNRDTSRQTLNAGLKPTGELPMHHLLQRYTHHTAEPRVVLHLHPTHVIAAIAKGYDLVEISKEFPEIYRYTRTGKTIPFIPPISQELAEAVRNSMLNHWLVGEPLDADIIGMAGHGTVSVGRDPWEAYEHVERLNHICEIYLLSR